MTEVQHSSKPRTWFRPTTHSADADIGAQLPASPASLTALANPATHRIHASVSSGGLTQPVIQLRLASHGTDCCSVLGKDTTAASGAQHRRTAVSPLRQQVPNSTASVAARSWRRDVSVVGPYAHCASSLTPAATSSETGLPAAHAVRSLSSMIPHAVSLTGLGLPPDKPDKAVAQSRGASIAPVANNGHGHGPTLPAPIQLNAWSSAASAAPKRLQRSRATWQRPEHTAPKAQVSHASMDIATVANTAAAFAPSARMQQATALDLHIQHQATPPACSQAPAAISHTTVTAIMQEQQHGRSATAEGMGAARLGVVAVRKRMTYIRRRTLSLDSSSSSRRPPSPRAVPVHLRAASPAQGTAAVAQGSITASHASSWKCRSHQLLAGAVAEACSNRAGRGSAGGAVGTMSSLQMQKGTPCSNSTGRLHTWRRQTSPATTARASARARQVLRQLRTPRPHTWHSAQLQASQQQQAQLMQPPTTRLPAVRPRQHMYVAARSRNSVLVRLSGGLAAGRVSKRSKRQPFLHTFKRTVQQQPAAGGGIESTASAAAPAAATAAKAYATSTNRLVSSAPKRKFLLPSRGRHRYVSQALQRSLANTRARAAAVKVAKARGHCLSYCRTGVCGEVLTGSCPHVHDASKRAVCSAWLQSTCTAVSCPLQHERRAELMPVCSFFLKGICSNGDCPYLHVNYPPDAPICRHFLAGHCPMGSACPKKHYSYSMAKQVGALKRKAQALDEKGGAGKEARLNQDCC